MEMPQQSDDGSVKRQKRYKAYLDDSDGQSIVSVRTSKRWKIRETEGSQHLSTERSSTIDNNYQTPQAQCNEDDLNPEEDECGDITDDSETGHTAQLIINEANKSDQYPGMCDDDIKIDTCDNDSGSAYSDNRSDRSVTSESQDDSRHEDLSDFLDGTDNSDSDDGDENPDADKDFLENWIMFEASNMSVWDVFSMIQAMSLRYKFSEELQQSVLEFAKILAGPKFKNLNTTKHTIAKIFNPPADKMAYVFFCRTCNTTLHDPIETCNMTNKNSATCSECSKDYLLTTSSDNYFLTIDIAYQIESILKNPDTERAIRAIVDERRNEMKDTEIISDVFDSHRYNNCDDISKNSQDKIVLTLNVNVDGAPLFNTSKRSLWPIQAHINEMPVKCRFKNLILAGLFLTSTEPKPALMRLYLFFFVNQILNLMRTGIVIKNDRQERKQYLVTVFSFPVDTPARALLQNRIQFNGYNGCSWCYALGDYIKGAMRYPLKLEEPLQRSHKEYLLDIETFEKLRLGMKNPERLSRREIGHISNRSRGSKGPSALTSLSAFDCVWGFPNEYLHSVLLGAFKQQWEEWCNPHSEIFLTPHQRSLVDARLISIKPTNEIHRLPRLLKDRAKWRGSEWRSWGLFYSVPCLHGILDDNALKSYMHLVRAVNTLLRSDITDDDLMQCEIDLITYVGDCQQLYGESFITFNIHSLIHLPESVRLNGPLWATSAFVFESNIGQLKKVVTGPKGVVSQIANRTLQKNSFKTRVSRMVLETEVQAFCNRVFNNRLYLKYCYRTTDGAVLAGIVSDETREFAETKYKRCIYNDFIYHSLSYTRANTTNNRVVELNNGFIVEIEYFLAMDICYLVGTQWETVPFDNGVEMSHIRLVNGVGKTKITIPITEVKQKLICVNVKKLTSVESDTDELELMTDDEIYVCILPNTVEVQ